MLMHNPPHPGEVIKEFSEHAETQIIRFPVVVCEKFENLLKTEDDYNTSNIKENFLLETGRFLCIILAHMR